jgi:hypothetical protein
MLKDILSIAGQSGLYKMVSQAKNGIIVESLTDGKRMPAYATSRISALEDISIYTEEGDIHLSEVFISIYEKNAWVSPKTDKDALNVAFKAIVPNYDAQRVYTSDIKKVFAWYKLLIDKEIISEASIKAYKAGEGKTEKEKIAE